MGRTLVAAGGGGGSSGGGAGGSGGGATGLAGGNGNGPYLGGGGGTQSAGGASGGNLGSAGKLGLGGGGAYTAGDGGGGYYGGGSGGSNNTGGTPGGGGGGSSYVAPIVRLPLTKSGAHAGNGSITIYTGGDIDHMPPVNTAAPTITGLPSTDLTLTGSPGTWSPAASSFEYQWLACSNESSCTPIAGASGQSYYVTDADRLDPNIRLQVTASNDFGSSVAYSALLGPVTRLLDRYAPQLRYDSNEAFTADSAAEITDNQQPGGYANKLLDGSELTIARPDNPDPASHLTLDYLGGTYPAGRQASSADHIDEENNYEDDWYRLTTEGYEDTIYGRIYPLANYGRILQYWLFYYYNPFPLDNHEGDWELVQLQVDYSGTPVRATYAQHRDGETCDWTHVQRTADGHPIVYVANGSHASYFSAGPHRLIDSADGNSNHQPTPRVEDITANTSWLTWPGEWGGTTGVSPVGPAFQSDEKWSQPDAWADAVTQCTESQTFGPLSVKARVRSALQTAPGRVPPVPVAHAKRSGSRAIIEYRFRTFPTARARRPWMIVTSVYSAGRKYPPFTVWSHVRARQGRIAQRIPRGHAPFRVVLSVYSRTGARSRTITVPVK